MKYIVRLPVLLVILSIVLGSSLAMPAQAQQDTNSLSGTVYDEDGNPIAGATVMVDDAWRHVYYVAGQSIQDNKITDVTCWDEEGHYYRDPYPSENAEETTTEANGFFTFEGLTSGQYYVFVRAEGFKWWWQGPLDAAETEELSVTLTAWREDDDCRYPEGKTVAFGGTVTDAKTGEPIEGASILIAGTCWSLRIRDGVLTDIKPMPRSNVAFADAEGHYRVSLAHGDYRVLVGAEGYQTLLVPRFEVSEEEDGDTRRTHFNWEPVDGVSARADITDFFNVALEPIPAEDVSAEDVTDSDLEEQETLAVVSGTIRPWSGEAPIADRQLALCRLTDDADDFVTDCELMEEVATTDEDGHFSFYEEIPEGRYIVLYDTGDHDFEAAIAEWAGKVLDGEWFDSYTDQLSDDGWVKLREPPSDDLFFQWPEELDLRRYVRTTLMIHGFPFIVAHDVDAMMDAGNIEVVIAEVTSDGTEPLVFDVFYFAE